MLGKVGGYKGRLCLLIKHNQQVISRWEGSKIIEGEITKYKGRPNIQARSHATFGADMLAW
jgi:hypothetical protein